MDSKVKEILSNKGFKIIKVFKEPDGSFIRSYVIVVKKEKEHYIFKYFYKGDIYALNRFKKEILFIKSIKNKLPNKYKNYVVDIQNFLLDSDHPFYIYKFVKGDPLGYFMMDFGIKWGQFKDENFNSFIEFLSTLSVTDLSGTEFEIDKWDKYIIDKEINHYFGAYNNILSETEKTRYLKFIDKYSAVVLKDFVISHKDLYPENILISKKLTNKFTFLDFENCSYVPIGFDAAFLILLFWREEYWQGKVYSYYYNFYNCHRSTKNKKTFEMSYRYCSIVLALRFMYQLRVSGDNKRSGYHEAMSFFYRCLIKSLDGSITKPHSIKFLIGEKELKEIIDDYKVGKMGNFEIFYPSKGNTVAMINTENNKKYIIRLYSIRRTVALINRELRIINFLNNSGIPTYKVIKFKNRFYENYEFFGIKQRVAVLTYVKGKKILREWANEDTANQAGALLRKIHDLNVVHGDYSKENVLFNKGKLTGVIDFEWGRFVRSKSAKYNDLARSLMLWIVDIRSKNIGNKDFIISFLKGYYGYLPVKKELVSILERVLDKIQEERDMFKNISDSPQVQRIGDRYDKATNNVYDLINE
jgi:Ser/Thr protein kinase RdoA (MazF antagonist)